MEIVIRPKSAWWKFDWRELWMFRDLFYFFTWRDIKVRYKQTMIGILWAVFQPLITMVIFTIFFGRLAHIPSDGIPYPIFVYVGLLFWTLFSSGLTEVSNAFVANEKIITKVYFPRIVLPVSSLFTSVVDFLIASTILIGMMFWYHYTPVLWGILLIPILVIMTILSALGIGLLFSSLNVKYRDVRFVLPFFIQLLLFLTPVIYPVSIAPVRYQWILGLNPMAGIIDTARGMLLGATSFHPQLLVTSGISMIVYCMIGYIYFKKTERYFADII